jgi:hypothetical protein
MYLLIRQSAPITEWEFAIELHEPGAEVYVFTLG